MAAVKILTVRCVRREVTIENAPWRKTSLLCHGYKLQRQEFFPGKCLPPSVFWKLPLFFGGQDDRMAGTLPAVNAE